MAFGLGSQRRKAPWQKVRKRTPPGNRWPHGYFGRVWGATSQAETASQFIANVLAELRLGGHRRLAVLTDLRELVTPIIGKVQRTGELNLAPARSERPV